MRNARTVLSVVRLSAALLILTLFANAVPTAAGQEVQVITSIEVLLSRDAVRPGETFKAAVVLEVKPGFHINDSAPLDEFLYPTSLDIEDTAGIELLGTFYPTGRRTKVDYSDVEVAVYEGRVILGLLLKAADKIAPGTVELRGSLSYQACDDATCLPPAEIGFEVVVPIAPASRKTVDTHAEIFEKIVFRTPAK